MLFFSIVDAQRQLRKREISKVKRATLIDFNDKIIFFERNDKINFIY